MSQAPQTQNPTPPAVTFEDAPGEHGFDRMFPNEHGDDRATSTPAPETEEVEEEAEQPSEAQTAAPVSDPALLARLASIEAQNQALTAQLSELLTQRSSETLANLLSKYEDAIATGDVAAAEKLRKDVEAFKQQTIAAATATQAAAPIMAPAGHWSHNITAEATTWRDAQSWWGVDGARTDAVRRIANSVDPVRFTSKEAYFTALLAAADESIGRKAPATAGEGRQPTPRANTQGASRGATGTPTPAGMVTSIKQLRGSEREAAEAAMRYGNLTEAQYLASYNAVRKTVNARKGK